MRNEALLTNTSTAPPVSGLTGESYCSIEHRPGSHGRTTVVLFEDLERSQAVPMGARRVLLLVVGERRNVSATDDQEAFWLPGVGRRARGGIHPGGARGV